MLRRCAAAWPGLACPGLRYVRSTDEYATLDCPPPPPPPVRCQTTTGPARAALLALRCEPSRSQRHGHDDSTLPWLASALLRPPGRAAAAGRRRAQSHARSAGQAAARSAPLVRCVRSLTSNTSFNVRAATAAPPCSTVMCMYVDRTDDEPMHAASDKRVYQQLACSSCGTEASSRRVVKRSQRSDRRRSTGWVRVQVPPATATAFEAPCCWAAVPSPAASCPGASS